jgi:hypothetical protein
LINYVLVGLGLVCACLTTTSTRADVFTDNFEAAHDYIADGVAGTGWDGTLGLSETRAPGGSPDVMDANDSRPGALYIESDRPSMLGNIPTLPGDPWHPFAPVLYKNITGDFTATVQITDFAGTADAKVFHNDSGMIARAPGEIGVDEEWVSVNYFPTHTGNKAGDAHDNIRSEWGFPPWPWKGFEIAKPYLQLERSGDTFYFRISDDGVVWESLDTSNSNFDVDGQSTLRTDLPDTLQVGLWQALYNPGGRDPYTGPGYAALDNFSIDYNAVVPEPSTIILLCMGAFGCLLHTRRKRK